MDRSHFSCPVLLLHPTGSSGALGPKTQSSNLTRDTETEPPNPHPTTTTTGSPSPPSTCFQPCFVPSTLALTPPQLSSQASYPTLHPISFPLTITSATKSPRVRFKLHYQHIQLFHHCPLQEANLSLSPEAVLPSRQRPCHSQPPCAVPCPHPGKQEQPQPHSTSPPGPSEPKQGIFTIAEPAK